MADYSAVVDIKAQLRKMEERKEEAQRKLEEELEGEKQKLVAPAKKRLEEIAKLRAELDKEEAALNEVLGERRDKRRRRGRRMTARHKAEVLARFISEGHVRNGMEFTRELRTALKDEGFTPNDFRRMTDYLPSGWEAKSNGMRGNAARTTFHNT